MAFASQTPTSLQNLSKVSITGSVIVLNSDGTLIATELPSVDPHVLGSIWSSSGTLHVSAG